MSSIGTTNWFQAQLIGIVEDEISDLVNPELEPAVRGGTAEALAMSHPLVRIGVVSTLALTSLVSSVTSLASGRSRAGRAAIWNGLPALPPIPQARQAVRGLALVSAAGFMDSHEH